jgi:hypothetical protein
LTWGDDYKPFLSYLLSRHLDWQMLAFWQENDGCVNRSGTHAFEQVAAPSGTETQRDIGKLAPHLAYWFGKRDLRQGVSHSNSKLPCGAATVSCDGANFSNVVEQATTSL